MLAAVLAAALAALTIGASAAPAPRFVGCPSFFPHPGVGSVRPRSIMLACGDGNFYVDGLKWMTWGSVASALGVGHQNDCTPYCAAGHFHAYRVSVRLDRARTCGTRRLFELTRVSWAFVGAKPAHVVRAGNETFRCA
jgi:hypothetical protein